MICDDSNSLCDSENSFKQLEGRADGLFPLISLQICHLDKWNSHVTLINEKN